MGIERLTQCPQSGCETICARPAGRGSLGGPGFAQTSQFACPASNSITPVVTPTADSGCLNGQFDVTGFDESSDNLHVQHDLSTSGKIALPCFGDAMGSQAAYLTY